MSHLDIVLNAFVRFLNPIHAVALKAKLLLLVNAYFNHPGCADVVLHSMASHGRALASLPGWLTVGPSTVHGTGIFCGKPFAKGEYLIIMTGTLLPSGGANNDSDDPYSYDIIGVRGIDALLMKEDSQCNIGKYINSSTRTTLTANCVVLEHEHGLLFVSASRELECMEELLLDYDI